MTTATEDAIGTVLRAAAAELREVSDTPDLDAGLLLAHVLQRPRSYLFSHPETTLTPAQAADFAGLLARRRGGEPVAYLLGDQGFWTFELAVSAAVLVPRPETELVVELALAALPADEAARVADLGTGSGAIALAIAAERPPATVVATDASEAALGVARANADRLGLTNLTFRRGDWFQALADGERYRLIVSNPPYIAIADPHLAALEHEPRAALVSGPDGLDALRRIIAEAPSRLTPGGRLLLEHGADQGAAVRELLAAAGLVEIQTHRDLAGHPRVTQASAPG